MKAGSSACLLFLMATACGNSNVFLVGPPPGSRVEAIVNGTPPGAPASHWAASDACGTDYIAIEIELTDDRAFASSITDTFGGFHPCTGNWVSVANGTGLMVHNPQGNDLVPGDLAKLLAVPEAVTR